ncbi:MAG: 3-isopropylmalate dehydratase large subunit [Candidatus Eisenbacteria bacterium]|nr:3-isopropylmalate dehydratase large subunit [Candidatus Eisenbacteria bacterium]
MGNTVVEKIISAHAGREVSPGDVVDVRIDARLARDFGGANVVRNLEKNGLGIDAPERTFFTFDCNPGGSDQKYAANQQVCRRFARDRGIRVYDIDMGIGTHLAIDEGLVGPGGTLVSTDSHANILGAIGAFGQGMGDQDIAYAWANGSVWFRVPRSMKITLSGSPSPGATPKDLVLACLSHFGASGLLGYSGEYRGEAARRLSLDGRVTVASMATEMGGIITFFEPSELVVEHCRDAGAEIMEVEADPDAGYDGETEVEIEGLGPMIARPGHPDDVVPVAEVAGTKVDSVFVGSCTNGRYEDMTAVANILRDRKVAPGVVLKIVPSTNAVWTRCLEDGLLEVFKRAGALVGNAGCAGCAAGQIGQNGPGEVTVSTGNRNYPGKQGKGEVYLASPETAAASAVAGVIATAAEMPKEPAVFMPSGEAPAGGGAAPGAPAEERPTTVRGRVWVVDRDNIDTDMIYHNRHLAVTELAEMGQYTFGNLPGWEDFPSKAGPGDILVTGGNFGCGSSRQQAVDCFTSLGVSLIIAKSFGAIYERNAINAGVPIMTADLTDSGLEDGDEVEVDLPSGKITVAKSGETFEGRPFSDVQMEIYQRGGLLRAA